MPMNSGVVDKGDRVLQCSTKMIDPPDTADHTDRSQSSTSSTQAQQQTKKPRKSLTSFSIFRRDKKFSESKIESAVHSAVGVAVAKDMAPQSKRSNNLVLDNTRLEVGSIDELLFNGQKEWFIVQLG